MKITKGWTLFWCLAAAGLLLTESLRHSFHFITTPLLILFRLALVWAAFAIWNKKKWGWQTFVFFCLAEMSLYYLTGESQRIGTALFTIALFMLVLKGLKEQEQKALEKKAERERQDRQFWQQGQDEYERLHRLAEQTAQN